jgi:hypothetical protein
VAIGLLRQHLNPGDKVHGIVTAGATPPTSCPPGRKRSSWSGVPRWPTWRWPGTGSCAASKPAPWPPVPPSRSCPNTSPTPRCNTITTSPTPTGAMPRPWAAASPTTRQTAAWVPPTWAMSPWPSPPSIPPSASNPSPPSTTSPSSPPTA